MLLRPRDLPIAAKLGLSALSALLLLGVLTWTVQQALGQLHALYQSSAVAEDASRRIGLARQAAVEMRELSRELQYRQAVAAVREIGQRVAAQAAESRRALSALADQPDTRASERALLADADGALAAYADSLAKDVTLRTTLIDLRDATFFPLQKPYAKALEGARVGLAAEDLPYTEIATVRSALEEYAAAITTMRGVALRFLASGDRSEELSIKDAAGNAAAALATIKASGISADSKAAVRELADVGSLTQRATADLFATATRAEAFDRDDVDGASQLVQQRLALCLQAFATAAAAARTEADGAMAAAQQRMLLIAGGIAVLMLGSSVVTTRLVAGPIRRMTARVQAMAAGDNAEAISGTDRRDEVGRMAAALETLRGVVRQAFLQSQIIEQLPLGVITADGADQRIGFVNPEAVRVLGTVRGHLAVAPEQLTGQPLSVIHHEQAGLGAVLGNPDRLPHRAQVQLGDEIFELNVSALRDREGRYVGPMIAWTVRTAQVRLSRQFEDTVGAIAASIGASAAGMTETAHGLSEGAKESGSFSGAVAAASDQAASNVQSVATSTEELAASVLEIGRQVSASAQIAGQAVREAEETDRSVTNLSAAANRIGDVVRLISEIAGRTNLLALNATIEAARAGETGKGFAVVASEVKTLATQTARATDEIATQISTMQGEVDQAVRALRSIGATIQQMNEIATAIAGAVEQQGATTQEIARSVQHAAAGTSDVNGNIGLVTAAVERTGQQALAVLDAARGLTAQSETLRGEAAAFLVSVREAA